MNLTPYTLFTTVLCISIFPFICISQISFKQNFDIINTNGYRSGLPISIVDVNGDGRDDIIRMTSRNILEVNFGSGNKQELLLEQFDAALPEEAWNISVGNLDNKGCNEIALGTIYKGGYIFTYDELSQQLKLIQTTAKDFYSQGANIVDINNDGYLDWFICDDEASNDIFINDGFGYLEEADSLIDMSTRVKSDNSGNYASDWVDIDSDGDLDFYISKCRSSALSDSDPRRINQLFINDGEQNFTEQGEKYGLANGAQTWATNFGDLDNDGDLDAVSINHGQKWNLFENIENDTFIDHPELLNSLSGFGIQCLMRDFDNNGYLDILVTGSNHYLWYNHGGFNFELDRKPFKNYVATNFTVGDVNHDGFLDVYVAHTEGYNDQGRVDDILYVNERNENNWVGLRLVGKESNKNGIGARIRVYTESLGWQIRDVRSGESYGMMNSLNRIFGLGEEDHIGSIEVLWPSGQKDVFDDIDINKYYTITEGTCIAEDEFAQFENDGLICENTILNLVGPKNVYDHWSSEIDENLNSEFEEILSPGLYTMMSLKQDECEVKVPSIRIDDFDATVFEEIIEMEQDATCIGSEITLTAQQAKSYAWSTGETSKSIKVDQPDIYSLITIDQCDNVHMEVAQVKFVDPLPINIVADTILKGEKAILTAEGENIYWYGSETEDKELHIGSQFEIPDVEAETTFYIEGHSTHQLETESTGEEAWKGTTRYNDASLNGGILFDVNKATVIESVDVYTDTIGTRLFQIKNADKEIIFELEQMLEAGKNIIDFNYTIYPGENYLMTTDLQTNISNFGYNAPRLQRSNTETKYPYRESDLLWLTNSNFGPKFMPYFYNWKVRPADLVCISDREPVTILVDFNSSTIDDGFEEFDFYPNPTSGEFNISNKDNVQIIDIIIFDSDGSLMQRIAKPKKALISIDISSMPPGIYSILIRSEDQQSYLKRLVKVN